MRAARGWYNGNRRIRCRFQNLMIVNRKTHAWELTALALFFFVFLDGEYLFDTTLANFLAPADVVLNQGMILGTSALGFCCYEPFSKWHRGAKTASSVIFIVVGFGSVILSATSSLPLIQVAGGISFFLLGVLGGAVHWMVSSRIRNSRHVALSIGFAYAAGIVIQFIANAACTDHLAASLPLAFGAIALLVVCRRCFAMEDYHSLIQPANETGEGVDKSSRGKSTSSASLRDALWLAAIVSLVSLMFITLDNIVTLADADGNLDVGSWPRLLLAASAIAAGALFDRRRHRYMNFLMFCVLLLSTIAILAAETSGGLFWGLVLFYLASGFFVTYFTTSFILLAPRTKRPALWAGMGRAINNACAFTITGPSLALIQTGSLLFMIAICIVLFVASIIVFFASGTFRLDERSGNERQNKRGSRDNRAAFVEEYGLTPREAEVLVLVTADERTLKEIASEMGISLRMLQKHLTSIYKKTDTQTRIGLTKKYLA